MRKGTLNHARIGRSVRLLSTALVMMSAALFAVGCGGGGSDFLNPDPPETKDLGAVTVSIQWPERAIPSNTDRIIVTIAGDHMPPAGEEIYYGDINPVTLHALVGPKTVTAWCFDDDNPDYGYYPVLVGKGENTVVVQSETTQSVTVTVQPLSGADLDMARGLSMLSAIYAGEEVPDPAVLQRARDHFADALAADPSHPEASLGWAICDGALLAAEIEQNPDARAAIEYFQCGSAESANLFSSLRIWNIKEAILGGSDPISLIVPNITSFAGLGTGLQSWGFFEPAARGTAADLVAGQVFIASTILPRLDGITDALSTAETDPSLAFLLGMYLEADARRTVGPDPFYGMIVIDQGDAFFMDASVRGIKCLMHVLTAYNLDFGDFDPTLDLVAYDNPEGNRNGIVERFEYLPQDPALTLLDGGAAAMAAARDEALTACDRLLAGIHATLVETYDYLDVIPWHSYWWSDVGGAELMAARSAAYAVRDMLTGVERYSFDYGGSSYSVQVALGAWFDNPPGDLKYFAPQFVILGSPGSEYCEVQPGSFRDLTFGGLFPSGLPQELLEGGT